MKKNISVGSLIGIITRYCKNDGKINSIIKKVILLLLVSYLFVFFLSANIFVTNLLPNHIVSILLMSAALLSAFLIPLNIFWLTFFPLVFLMALFHHSILPLLVIPVVFVVSKFSYIKLDFILRLIATGLIIFIFRNFTTKNVYNPVMGHWKFGLGLGNPNTLGQYTLILLMEMAFLKRHFNRWFYYLGVLILIILLLASDSRTAILLYLIFLVLRLVFLCRSTITSKLLEIIVGLFPFICFAFSLAMTLWYKFYPGILIKSIDQEFSNRWRQAAKFLTGLSLFGVKVHSTAKDALDVGYIHILISTGVILTIVFLLCMSWILLQLLHREAYQLLVPLLTMCILGISEGFIIQDPFLISALVMLIKDQCWKDKYAAIREV